MSDTYKFTLSLSRGLYNAYEQEAESKGLSTHDLMRDTLRLNADKKNWQTGDFGFDIVLYRDLTKEVADAAERIVNEEGWKEDITLLAIKDRLEDPKWLADYKKLIGDDNVFVAGNQTKTSVNQNFGQYVKIRLKAKNKLDASGKRVTRQVAGELVRTYTLLVRKS